MNYWLCITTEKNHAVSLSENVWGVDHRNEKKLDKFEQGDELIFYVIGKKLGGAFKVISNVYKDENKIFNGGLFPFRINIEPIKIPNSEWFTDWTDEIIQNADFIKHKDYRWKFEFMGRSIKPLSKKDYNYLLSNIH